MTTVRLPEGGPGLAQIKTAVRDQPAYSLAPLTARRKLNQNENPYDVPPDLKRLVLERVAALPWNRYPEFVPAALLELLSQRYDWPAEGILVGNGSNELIQATLHTALDAGDRVVAPTPTFSLYRLITGVAGGRYVPVAFGPDFHYAVDALVEVAAREQARVIVLNSPNNPTGSALPEGAVERILDATDALVVCDEAYQDFGGPTAREALAASSRVVILRTFSKALGMAGLRFGVALAHPSVAREIAKAKLPYNVNLGTLAAAAVLLEHDGFRRDQIREIVASRDRAVARLRELRGLTVYPSAANFFLIRCVAVPAKETFRRLLEEHGILVRDVSATAELAECLRVSVGTPEDMEAVVVALGAIFGGR
ncbi:MAG TPA: histidinol-phosphate transaminase [Gemmatimonadales bacterium]|nr:histidinol-phosphate transaminase [Gemmatimonadales bacterium]